MLFRTSLTLPELCPPFRASVSGQTSLTAFQQTVRLQCISFIPIRTDRARISSPLKDLAAGLATALANFHSQQVIVSPFLPSQLAPFISSLTAEELRNAGALTVFGWLGHATDRHSADVLKSLATRLQPTWDYLLKTQIDKLESHGVPGLGTSKIERESELGSGRLRKILGVLEGALEDV